MDHYTLTHVESFSTTLPQLFESQARKTPDAVALVYEDECFTYGYLDKAGNQLAHALQRHEVGTEVPVGIYLERSPLFIISVLGVFKAGGVYVPLDPDYPQARLAFMVEDSQIALIITERSQTTIPGPTAPRALYLDQEWSAISQEPTSPCQTNIHIDNLAYIIYTSGSTGQPKGTMNIHRGICNRLLRGQEICPIGENDKFLFEVSCSFDVSIWETFWPLIAGATIILARHGVQRDTAHLLRLILKYQVTVAHFSPSLLHVLLQEPEIEQCVTLQHVFCGGEVLSKKLQEQYLSCLNARLHNQYGPTETSAHTAYWECLPEENRSLVPIGKPLANTQIYILDKDLQPVSPDSPGEIYIGGCGLGRGYLGHSDLTAERFIPDPFGAEVGARMYKTGDLARYRDDYVIEFLDRIDRQVKIRGYRIEPGEVEAALCHYPSIREALVLVQENTTDEKYMVAYVVSEEEGASHIADIRSYLKTRLPTYMIPTALVLLARFPLTSNGKIDQHALPVPGEDNVSSSVAFVSYRTLTEEKLFGIWAKVLNTEHISIFDNFFAIGGHSLKATQVVSRIRNTFHIEFPLFSFFDNPTIAALAQVLEQEYAIADLSEETL